jgi:hypothetical protein
LNAIADRNTAREGATKRKERSTHHKQHKKGTVSKTQNRITKRVRENCDQMKLELSYLFKSLTI